MSYSTLWLYESNHVLVSKTFLSVIQPKYCSLISTPILSLLGKLCTKGYRSYSYTMLKDSAFGRFEVPMAVVLRIRAFGM
jgi:hypothetical protein